MKALYEKPESARRWHLVSQREAGLAFVAQTAIWSSSSRTTASAPTRPTS
ncbi:MAG: hypothetical protein ACLVJ6_08380 [Merdibacter sp.]